MTDKPNPFTGKSAPLAGKAAPLAGKKKKSSPAIPRSEDLGLPEPTPVGNSPAKEVVRELTLTPPPSSRIGDMPRDSEMDPGMSSHKTGGQGDSLHVGNAERMHLLKIRDIPDLFEHVTKTITDLGTLGYEIELKLENGKTFWLVPKYTDEPRNEYSYEDASKVAILCSAFGGRIGDVIFEQAEKKEQERMAAKENSSKNGAGEAVEEEEGTSKEDGVSAVKQAPEPVSGRSGELVARIDADAVETSLCEDEGPKQEGAAKSVELGLFSK